MSFTDFCNCRGMYIVYQCLLCRLVLSRIYLLFLFPWERWDGWLLIFTTSFCGPYVQFSVWMFRIWFTSVNVLWKKNINYFTYYLYCWSSVIVPLAQTFIYPLKLEKKPDKSITCLSANRRSLSMCPVFSGEYSLDVTNKRESVTIKRF